MSTSAADIFNKKLLMEGVKAHTLVYVDDFLVIAETHIDLVAAFRVMDEEELLLGLTFNAKKDLGEGIDTLLIKYFLVWAKISMHQTPFN